MTQRVDASPTLFRQGTLHGVFLSAEFVPPVGTFLKGQIRLTEHLLCKTLYSHLPLTCIAFLPPRVEMHGTRQGGSLSHEMHGTGQGGALGHLDR